MAIETEYKYLVNDDHWKLVVPHKSVAVKQAYLLTDPSKTIRVRTLGDKGYITIKGKATGASRLEYEYEIPVAEAVELIRNFGDNVIEKTRHYVIVNNHTWEVDEFEGLNKGLWVAEIELQKEDEFYELPVWAGQNVTDDMRYANSNLSIKPFSKW